MLGEIAPFRYCQIVLAPLIVPVQVKFPVAPSTVQPVAPEPPAKFMEVAVVEPGPIFSVEAAPAKLTVVAVELIKSKVEVPVVIELLISGDVLNTIRPEPVSSEKDKAALAEEILVVS